MTDKRTKASLVAELEVVKSDLTTAQEQSYEQRRKIQSGEAKTKELQSEVDRLKAAILEIKNAIRTANALRYPNVDVTQYGATDVWHNGKYITIKSDDENEEVRLMRLLYSLCEKS